MASIFNISACCLARHRYTSYQQSRTKTRVGRLQWARNILADVQSTDGWVYSWRFDVVGSGLWRGFGVHAH